MKGKKVNRILEKAYGTGFAYGLSGNDLRNSFPYSVESMLVGPELLKEKSKEWLRGYFAGKEERKNSVFLKLKELK